MTALPGVLRVTAALVDGLDAILGRTLCALYIHGAAVFPETEATGDVDFHALLEGPLTDADKRAISSLHAALSTDYPPLGGELDGYYVLLSDARRTEPPHDQLRPRLLDEAWALHRAHLRAGRCLALRGPDPKTICPAVSWPELEAALQGEFDYVVRHLREYPDYCVLNLCRLMYSFETKDVVVSKWRAAAWAAQRFPQGRQLIDCARRSYERRASDADRAALRADIDGWLAFARRRIAACAAGGAE